MIFQRNTEFFLHRTLIWILLVLLVYGYNYFGRLSQPKQTNKQPQPPQNSTNKKKNKAQKEIHSFYKVKCLTKLEIQMRKIRKGDKII